MENTVTIDYDAIKKSFHDLREKATMKAKAFAAAYNTKVEYLKKIKFIVKY